MIKRFILAVQSHMLLERRVWWLAANGYLEDTATPDKFARGNSKCDEFDMPKS